MIPDMSFGRIVSGFFSFHVLLKLAIIFGPSDVLKGWSGSGESATTKTGPNDTRCVIWVVSSKFIFFRVLLVLTFFFFFFFFVCILKERGGLRKATTTKTGPVLL
jgi:quinol-cytochrome oxidoreductase complex cytochrome b subunit